jgi:AAA+ ATPase superfamily predicted ATPase
VQDQLQSFSQIISRYFSDSLLAMRPFATWDELFLYLHQRIQKRTAVIVDEYPYLLEAQPGLGTVLQKYWDEYFSANRNVFLVLNGSALSMMEKETLESKSPLYGRRTGQWFVSPFSPMENNKFFDNTSLIRCIEWYAISGGMPYYSQIFSRHETPLEAILHEVLTYGEALFDEVEFVLRGEFRNPRSYFPILKAIATGSHKFGEISSKTGYDRANLTKYLAALESLQLIYRETPITEKQPEKSKKGLYFLRDYFMNLWFHYVFPHLAELEIGGKEQTMEKVIRPTFDKYISQVCERIIRQLLQEDFFELKLQFDRIGRHWGSQAEIDIVAYTKDGNTLISESNGPPRRWGKRLCTLWTRKSPALVR